MFGSESPKVPGFVPPVSLFFQCTRFSKVNAFYYSHVSIVRLDQTSRRQHISHRALMLMHDRN